MNVGSLFSGIGGIDLGLERAGMHVSWQCELDPWCRGILARHWPDVPCYGDVRSIGADAPRVDVLAGGFPCQPVSLAGKGLAQADERWLWPEFARLVRVLRPRYVIAENVPGLLARGLDLVLADLAALGFDAEWTVFGARDVGAPHRRERVWIVATDSNGSRQRSELGHVRPGEPDPARSIARLADADGARLEGQDERESALAQPSGRRRDVADAASERCRARSGLPGSEERRHAADRGPASRLADADSDGLPRITERDEPSIDEAEGHDEPRRRHADRRDPDGRERVGDTAAERGWAWPAEPDVGRVAHGVPARVDRLKALGNAVVPACAEHIGRLVMEMEEERRG